MTTSTPLPLPSPSPGVPPRRRFRLFRMLAWGMVLVLAALAGALGFAVSYVTDSDTLATLIREEAPRFFPDATLEVGRVQMRPFLGEVTLGQVLLRQQLEAGAAFPTAQVAWMSIRCDLRALSRGEFQPREIVAAQPVLRLRRRPDGRWNLDGLLAEPWPAPPLESVPVVMVRNGTVELIEGAAADAPVMVLRDVSLRAEPTGVGNLMRVEGTARGGPFDRLRFLGTIDRQAGTLELTEGDLTGLALSEDFCRCLPDPDLQAAFRGLGLSGGGLDVALSRLSYDPAASTPLRYAARFQLHGGSLARPELPFALSDLAAVATLTDGRLQIEHAEGRYGKTLVQVSGSLSVADPKAGPLDLNVAVTGLELDDRLRRATPPEYAQFWEEFQPRGWVNLGARLVRARPGDPLGLGLTIGLRDVAAEYREFPYPVSHIRGTIVWRGPTITLDLETVLGGAKLTGTGTIQDPGPDAVADLTFTFGAIPVDEALMKAMPPEVEAVVRDFQPDGSVRGTLHVTRRPPGTPGAPDNPTGIDMHAELDLNDGFSIRWAGLPYLVRDLTGHLDLRPDRWTFTGMRGRNGPATLQADGQVVAVGPGEPAVELRLTAENLPFEPQLRDALPPEWQATWATLNPSGSSRVEAHITTGPDRAPHYHFTVVPDPAETRVQLVLTPLVTGPDGTRTPTTPIHLPQMDHVSGTFVFDDGTVTMTDVKCVFREAPVECRGGTVVLHDTGAFHLAVRDLLVTKLRLDAELRKIMPPVMAQFARRLDDGRTFWLRGDLEIDWSGLPGEPARCVWENTTVVLNGNTIQTGLPLESLQGQIEQVSGSSNGQDFSLRGFINLESVRLQRQQVTQLRSPLVVEDGLARLDDVQGSVLGGRLFGRVAVSLESTPRFDAHLELDDADLSRYTLTLPGRQNLRGRLSGRLDLAGEGNDLRTVTGQGWARVTQGDLGQLPLALRWAKVTNFSPPTKTAFDAVEIGVEVANGEAVLDPVKLTGDAFSLLGSGTVELLGNQKLDLRLSPLYGRSERPLPLVGAAMREASGRVVDLHVTGPLNSLEIRPEPLPDVLTRASAAMRRLADRDDAGTSTGPTLGLERALDWERGRVRLWDRPSRTSAPTTPGSRAAPAPTPGASSAPVTGPVPRRETSGGLGRLYPPRRNPRG